MAVFQPRISLKAPEPEIDDGLLLQHKEKVLRLIKLIVYIGPEHEDVAPLASDLYELLGQPSS